MNSTVVYPVFCPECGDIHKSRVRDTVTVENLIRSESREEG